MNESLPNHCITFRERSDHQARVEDFMRLARQELPTSPKIPGFDVLMLRASLILEEALETVQALGFDLHASRVDGRTHIGLIPNHDKIAMGLDLAEIVDGCCDLMVVTTGTLSACGVADVGVQAEVDENNLAKFGPGHTIREDGKLIKPPDHQPPRLHKILADQGYVVPVRF